MMWLATLLSRPCSSRYAASITLLSSRPYSSTCVRREEKTAQPQTPATDGIELSSPAAFISESDDPWFNLSYEDWLLRNTPRNQPVLFFYRNRPCVVIGRNQNPWKETTPRNLRQWAIPLIRRRSGGGTVFHDMGNTNFSIILPRLMFTRAHGAELVARAVREKLSVEKCTVNSRNDVIVRDGERELKVSGSAYKIIQHRAYHHGTMLISSSLDQLGKALRSSSPNIETKGIPSFRSPVTTLNYHRSPGAPEITHDTFVQAVVDEFEKVYALPGGGDLQVIKVARDGSHDEKVWKGIEEMKTWEWEYGSSPEFSNLIEGDLSFGSVSVSLTARHGLITSLTFHLTPPLHAVLEEVRRKQDFLDTLALTLIGKRYESLEEADQPLPQGSDRILRDIQVEVVDWLRQAM